ncbi:MAG: hypothetical protein GX367_05910 [Bacteroidales bacterium]|nr:hypothetical protein [Bacteroidales bacterium]
MKTVWNVLLGIAIIVLVYMCYASIMGPINFEKSQKIREKAIIARLMDIRKAQQEFKSLNKQKHTNDFDSLIHFVKTQKLPIVAKEGVLSDEQLESGLTESKAINIINKAKKTNNWSEVKKLGLENFSRDTIWIPIKDTIFTKNFNVDSLRFVPYGNGKQFQMDTVTILTEAGAPINLLEVKTPYETYLGDLDRQELINIIDRQTKMNRYPGLKFGDLMIPNNNAGNWE